jgi:hypothetical protein
MPRKKEKAKYWRADERQKPMSEGRRARLDRRYEKQTMPEEYTTVNRTVEWITPTRKAYKTGGGTVQKRVVKWKPAKR